VAIWIDREMRAFEAEFARESRTNRRIKDDREVTGHRPRNVLEIEMGDIRIEETQQQ